MIKLTKEEYYKIHPDYRNVWTTEREDLKNWSEIRINYIGKRTYMQDGGLLIEGIHFEIV